MVWTDDVRKMTLGNWIRKVLGSSIEQKLEEGPKKEPDYLMNKLGEQVLDGKAILFNCNEAYPVYLAKAGVPAIAVYRTPEPLNVISDLAQSIDGKLKVSTGTVDEVDLSSDVVGVYSSNPFCPSFMERFVMKHAPYEVLVSDCKGMSEEHFQLLADYANKAVKEGKYILFKNVDLKKCAALLDCKHKNWTEIAHENTFCKDNYGVLYKKETDEIQILRNESEQLDKDFEIIGRD